MSMLKESDFVFPLLKTSEKRFKRMYLIKFHRCFILWSETHNEAVTFNRRKIYQLQLTLTEHLLCFGTLNVLSYLFLTAI